MSTVWGQNIRDGGVFGAVCGAEAHWLLGLKSSPASPPALTAPLQPPIWWVVAVQPSDPWPLISEPIITFSCYPKVEADDWIIHDGYKLWQPASRKLLVFFSAPTHWGWQRVKSLHHCIESQKGKQNAFSQKWKTTEGRINLDFLSNLWNSWWSFWQDHFPFIIFFLNTFSYWLCVLLNVTMYYVTDDFWVVQPS